jgi:hypothetical protein
MPRRIKKGGELYSFVKPIIDGKQVYCFGNNLSHDTLKQSLASRNKEHYVKINSLSVPNNIPIPRDLKIKGIDCEVAIASAKTTARSELAQARLEAENQIEQYKRTIHELKIKSEKGMNSLTVPAPIPTEAKKILGTTLSNAFEKNPLMTEKTSANKLADAVSETAVNAAKNVDATIKSATDMIANGKKKMRDLADAGHAMVMKSLSKGKALKENVQEKTNDLSEAATQFVGKMTGDVSNEITPSTSVFGAPQTKSLTDKIKDMVGIKGGRKTRLKRKKRRSTRKRISTRKRRSTRKKKTKKRKKHKKRKTRKRKY